MALSAVSQQPYVCSLKVYKRKSNGVVLLASKHLRSNNNHEDKSTMFSLRSKFTMLSTLNTGFSSTTGTEEDFAMNLEIDPEGKDIQGPMEKSFVEENVAEKEMELGNKEFAKLSWVDRFLPKKAQPYARLARIDKPIVTWLYIWPSFWAMALAASPGSLPNVTLMALFGIASIFTRGYACTINDIFDRDVDKKVHRSKQRPIASGAVTPLQGIAFLLLQLFASIAILHPILNNYSKVMGVPVFPLFSTYPLMKRLTHWPQAYLGVAMNWITIVAWSAIKGSIDLPVLVPLFISLSFWTLSYDTIYAHQDRADDIKAGVKSTAVLFGDSTKTWCTIFNIICIGCLAISGFNAKIGWPFYVSLVAAAGHLTWQIITVDLSNSNDCKSKFISNIWFGAIVFFGACLGRLLN